MTKCDAIQKRLAEHGSSVLHTDAALKAHVGACSKCSRFFDSLREIEMALNELPHYQPSEDLLTTIKDSIQQTNPRRSIVADRRWAGGLASAAVILAVIGLSQTVFDSIGLRTGVDEGLTEFARWGGEKVGEIADIPLESAFETEAYRYSTNQEQSRYYDDKTRGADRNLTEMEVGEIGAADVPQAGAQTEVLNRRRDEQSIVEDVRHNAPIGLEERITSESIPVIVTGGLVAQLTENKERQFEIRDAQQQLSSFDRELRSRRRQVTKDNLQEGNESADQFAVLRGSYANTDAAANGSASTTLPATDTEAPESRIEGQSTGVIAPLPAKPDLSEVSQSKRKSEMDLSKHEGATDEYAHGAQPPERGKAADQSADGFGDRYRKDDRSAALAPGESISVTRDLSSDSGRGHRPADAAVQGPSDTARRVARRFLAELDSTDGLHFQQSSGYWANTYVPGDPTMRMLQARLRSWNRPWIDASAAPASDLEQAVRRIGQPFDIPKHSALAVYLDADKASIDGPTRMRLQVGIQGTQRQGGHRPAMNVALVLDLDDDLGAAENTNLRALVSALETSKQSGDRFALIVAGDPGGVVVAPEQFRHGPLQVAMNQLFAPTKPAGGLRMNLQQALATAVETTRPNDDLATSLGTSLVLLATASTENDDLLELERLAHESAINGVMVSVVSVGDRVSPDHIDRIVLAGQGNRRVLRSSDKALTLMETELHAASRAIARALRLRIRLAPGVRLVEVLGSQRLQDPQVERVREAEQSIDQRLARNLGIHADRGDDEEGIQIVIPSFHASDAHVILLDVVADKPGPVADVTVRYKDLVNFRNNIARAQFSLGGGRRPQGPLQRNVLKNLLAWKLSDSAWQASQFLSRGSREQAMTTLSSTRELLQGLRAEVGGWAADGDLVGDEKVLGEYLAVLTSPAAVENQQRLYLADSLRYAALRKLLAEP